MEEKRDKLIYDVVLDRYHEEQKTTTDLDSKAGNITSIAGLLATLIAAAVSYVPKAPYHLLFVIPIILLITCAIMGLLALWVKDYKTIEPQKFIEVYKNSELTRTLRDYVATIALNTKENKSVNLRRAEQIQWAFVLLIVAISLFFATVIINWIL